MLAYDSCISVHHYTCTPEYVLVNDQPVKYRTHPLFSLTSRAVGEWIETPLQPPPSFSTNSSPKIRYRPSVLGSKRKADVGQPRNDGSKRGTLNSTELPVSACRFFFFTHFLGLIFFSADTGMRFSAQNFCHV